MPLFVLSPASLAHSALFAGYYSYLTTNVVALRLKTGVFIGQGEAGSVRDPAHKASASDAQDEENLKRAVRSAGNFAEHTPFAFFLIFLSELNGAPTAVVHAAYSTLFLARVAHDAGIKAPNAVGLGRPIGFVATALLTVSAGLYNLSLGWEPLKSFAGLK
ncbi:Membrane-associated, eicosanoid/glutathione metabolism (MAPEG) protein [Ceraceosorus bombacis]|uniref:Membrane-associated, eicosanoid/glutathione metabolism (MAPEG) protein n=1 Tax=Ceraceosorus bombacis TaxID=401625 RepID=A0A0P1BFU2_9BASI|nr:Membrane-associated, eicosanoid/glutathione metabolism (MAPEG) protein [Ceraceosorus bombacis]